MDQTQARSVVANLPASILWSVKSDRGVAIPHRLDAALVTVTIEDDGYGKALSLAIVERGGIDHQHECRSEAGWDKVVGYEQPQGQAAKAVPTQTANELMGWFSNSHSPIR